MCIALIGQVVAIANDEVQVHDGRRVRRACALFFPDLKVGDYIVVSADIVVDRLDPAEALERSTIFKRMLEVSGETS